MEKKENNIPIIHIPNNNILHKSKSCSECIYKYDIKSPIRIKKYSENQTNFSWDHHNVKIYSLTPNSNEFNKKLLQKKLYTSHSV